MSKTKKKTDENKFTMSNDKIREEILANENLGATAYAVYMTILSFRHNKDDDFKGLCCPSITTIMEKCSLSRSTVNRQLTALYEAGYLEIDTGRQHHSNHYAFPKEPFYCDLDIGNTFWYGNVTTYSGRKRRAFRKKDRYNHYGNASETAERDELDDELDDDFGC